MSDEDLAAASEELEKLREDVRSALAEDLGGDPDDYRADDLLHDDSPDRSDEAVPDGGE